MFPTLLLFLYPCRCCQRILNKANCYSPVFRTHGCVSGTLQGWHRKLKRFSILCRSFPCSESDHYCPVSSIQLILFRPHYNNVCDSVCHSNGSYSSTARPHTLHTGLSLPLISLCHNRFCIYGCHEPNRCSSFPSHTFVGCTGCCSATGVLHTASTVLDFQKEEDSTVDIGCSEEKSYEILSEWPAIHTFTWYRRVISHFISYNYLLHFLLT